MFVKAALNGTRSVKEYLQIPLSPEQIALEGQAAVAAGASALHIHPRNEDGNESLVASDISAAINAIRAASVKVPIGVSTGEWIEPNINKKLSLIKSWTVLPDFASVNFNERGAEDVAQLLLSRNIGLEAGINSVEAARRFQKFKQIAESLRVLIEVPDLNAKESNKLI